MNKRQIAEKVRARDRVTPEMNSTTLFSTDASRAKV